MSFLRVIPALAGAVLGAWAVQAWLHRNDHTTPSTLAATDAVSSVRWEMHGRPELEDRPLHVSAMVSTSPSYDAPRRIYTAAHGDWMERVAIVEVPDDHLRETLAAGTIAPDQLTAELQDKLPLTVAGHPGIRGTVTVINSKGMASARVFAVYIDGHMITGAVAETGNDPEMADRFRELVRSVRPPR